MPKNELQSRIDELITEHKGVRAAAVAVRIDPSYLLRLRGGMTTNPSTNTLKKLGLKRTVTYVRIGA